MEKVFAIVRPFADSFSFTLLLLLLRMVLLWKGKYQNNYECKCMYKYKICKQRKLCNLTTRGKWRSFFYTKLNINIKRFTIEDVNRDEEGGKFGHLKNKRNHAMPLHTFLLWIHIAPIFRCIEACKRSVLQRNNEKSSWSCQNYFIAHKRIIRSSNIQIRSVFKK